MSGKETTEKEMVGTMERNQIRKLQAAAKVIGHEHVMLLTNGNGLSGADKSEHELVILGAWMIAPYDFRKELESMGVGS